LLVKAIRNNECEFNHWGIYATFKYRQWYIWFNYMDPPPPNFQGSASKGNYNDTSEQLDGDSIDDTTTLSNSEKSGLPQTKFEVLSSELIEELTRDSRSSGKKLADGTQRRNAKAWVELTTKLVQMGQLSEESLVKEGVSTDFKEISDVIDGACSLHDKNYASLVGMVARVMKKEIISARTKTACSLGEIIKSLSEEDVDKFDLTDHYFEHAKRMPLLSLFTQSQVLSEKDRKKNKNRTQTSVTSDQEDLERAKMVENVCAKGLVANEMQISSTRGSSQSTWGSLRLFPIYVGVLLKVGGLSESLHQFFCNIGLACSPENARLLIDEKYELANDKLIEGFSALSTVFVDHSAPMFLMMDNFVPNKENKGKMRNAITGGIVEFFVTITRMIFFPVGVVWAAFNWSSKKKHIIPAGYFLGQPNGDYELTRTLIKGQDWFFDAKNRQWNVKGEVNGLDFTLMEEDESKRARMRDFQGLPSVAKSFGTRGDWIETTKDTINTYFGNICSPTRYVILVGDEEQDKHYFNWVSDISFTKDRDYYSHTAPFFCIFHTCKNYIETVRNSGYYRAPMAFLLTKIFLEKNFEPAHKNIFVKHEKAAEDAALAEEKEKKKVERERKREATKVVKAKKRRKVEENQQRGKRELEQITLQKRDNSMNHNYGTRGKSMNEKEPEAPADAVAPTPAQIIETDVEVGGYEGGDGGEGRPEGEKGRGDDDEPMRGGEGVEGLIAEIIDEDNYGDGATIGGGHETTNEFVEAILGELESIKTAADNDATKVEHHQVQLFNNKLDEAKVHFDDEIDDNNEKYNVCQGPSISERINKLEEFQVQLTKHLTKTDYVPTDKESDFGYSTTGSSGVKCNFNRAFTQFVVLWLVFVEIKKQLIELLIDRLSARGVDLGENPADEKVIEAALESDFGERFRYAYELFDVDMYVSCEIYTAWEDGDMKPFMRNLPWIMCTFGAFGRHKLMAVCANYLEQHLRWQKDCPLVITYISRLIKRVNNYYIECRNGMISWAFKTRTRSDMTVLKLIKESINIDFYRALRERFASTTKRWNKDYEKKQTENEARWAKAKEHFSFKSGSAHYYVLLFFKNVIDGEGAHANYKYKCRLNYYKMGKWEKDLKVKTDSYYGGSRLRGKTAADLKEEWEGGDTSTGITGTGSKSNIVASDYARAIIKRSKKKKKEEIERYGREALEFWSYSERASDEL